MLEECAHLAFGFKEFNHLVVETGVRLISVVFARVVDCAAVEGEAAAVARRVVRNTFLVGEAHHSHGERVLLQLVGELLHAHQLVEHL